MRLAGLEWLGEGGEALSESSTDEEQEEPQVPSRPVPPSLDRRSELRATWDLLSRPDGFSLRRTYRMFVAAHGRPNELWFRSLLVDPTFVVYAPLVDTHDGRAGMDLAALPPLGRGGIDPEAALQFPGIFIRRAWPHPTPVPPSHASPRLQAALDALSNEPVAPSSPALALAHAGAAQPPPPELYRIVHPAPFARQRLDRRPDVESLLTPMPHCNIALSIEHDLDPPDDQPILTATSMDEIVTRRGMRALRAFRRRERRCYRLAERGKVRQAREHKPDDISLDWRRHTKPKFQGVIMDFSTWPFSSLQPNRWPDRPPSTDLHIRAIRREFRSHPSFPNKQLRGMLSHGTPVFGECSRVTHMAAPHGSALSHFSVFQEKRQIELDNGWGKVGFERSLGCATWPLRQVPSSIAFRDPLELTGPRLCTDLSWPKPGTCDGVDSPNDAQKPEVALVKFVRLHQFCTACAILLVAGATIRVWKLDLVAAYKRTAQQRMTRWYRQFGTPDGCQTLDRISFGQTDGPSSFSEQTNLYRFLIVREIRYADACYPTRDPTILAYLLARGRVFGVTSGSELTTSFLMVLLDDFGGVSFCDPLWRISGEPLLEPNGIQTTRDQLHFRVAISVLRRAGHDFDPTKPDKYTPPTQSMVLIGGHVDVGQRETLSLEPRKRVKYLKLLNAHLALPAIRSSALTSLAFKMLVVCEFYPLGRQWLHSVFRCLRSSRLVAVISWDVATDAASDLHRFQELLRSPIVLEIPLACRLTFPFEGQPELIVKYDDASGEPRLFEARDGQPGFGSWTVRDNTLYYIHGVWTAHESRLLSISLLEFLASLFSTNAFSALFADASHILEFTDNTGVEWSSRKETARRELMQLVTAKRSDLLAQRGLVPRSARVSSADNIWADDLSRQRVSKVLAEAAARGLACCRVELPADVRDTEWLLAHARRIAGTRQ